jgi:hypothetical protein
MLTLFLNPFTMLAGAGLVLAPIIIHLINRLRYRKVPWAAMEFLLKSLKKNRRKLILKQLLLLLMRCMLVLLVGLLLARYIGSALGFGTPRGTLHVVLLDDTASQGDQHREEGATTTAFARAKAALVDDIATGAAEAGTPQTLEVIRLSAPDESFRVDRLDGSGGVSELQAWLANVEVTALHADVAPAVEAAKRAFSRDPRARRVLHVVSDFRARDWAGPAAESLSKAIPEAVDGKSGALHFLDTAHPPRSTNRSAVPDHGNVGILDLQPDTRTVGLFLPVEFTLTIANYSQSSRKNVRVVVKVNGQPREDASTSVSEVAPGLTTATFIATFDKPGVNMVTAEIPPDEAGQPLDDIRYAAVEVRNKVPLLFVTADAQNRGKQEGDGFYLRALFLDAAKGFEVVERGPQELEAPALDKYPAIFLLNLPRLNDKAKAAVDAYVRAGGGLFVALGDQSDPDFYTKWHAGGQGVFPAPIGKATDPPSEAQKLERLFDPAMPPKLYPRADGHPITTRLYRDDRNREVNTYLKFLAVDRYFPVARARWSSEPGAAEELFTLPNYRNIDDYKEPAQKLLAKLPVDDAKLTAYRDRLREWQRRVKEILAANRPPYALADAIESLLNESADPARPGTANLQEFWARPDQLPLKIEMQRFLESVRFGEPLVIAQPFGRGRVFALLSSAGNAWNDWPSGPARPYWVMLMLEAQKFLAGVGPDANRFVGMPVEITLDPNRYEARLRRWYLRDVPPDAPPGAGTIDQGEQVVEARGSVLSYTLGDARKPGLYRIDLMPKPDASGNPPQPESRAYSFNVDTAAEGDLRRATRDELATAGPGMSLHAPGSGLARVLRARPSDLSESPWFYAGLLALLLAEQALAVHLSYHVRGDAPAIPGGPR